MKLFDILDELGGKMTALAEVVERRAYGRGLLDAGKVVEQIRAMPNAEKRLMAGEMTVQEIRTLDAWLGVISDQLVQRGSQIVARNPLPSQETEE